MKQAMNFRLSTEAIAIVSVLAKELHASKTDVIEQALQYYAKKKLTLQQPLLKFSGKLSEDDAMQMLTTIESNKHNKDIDTIL